MANAKKDISTGDDKNKVDLTKPIQPQSQTAGTYGGDTCCKDVKEILKTGVKVELIGVRTTFMTKKFTAR